MNNAHFIYYYYYLCFAFTVFYYSLFLNFVFSFVYILFAVCTVILNSQNLQILALAAAIKKVNVIMHMYHFLFSNLKQFLSSSYMNNINIMKSKYSFVYIFAIIKLYYIANPRLQISILELDINKTNISLLIKITLLNWVKPLCFRVRPVLTLIFLVLSCINVMSESKRNRSTVVPYSHVAGLFKKKKRIIQYTEKRKRRGGGKLRKENKSRFLFIFWMISLERVLKIWLGRFWYPE